MTNQLIYCRHISLTWFFLESCIKFFFLISYALFVMGMGPLAAISCALPSLCFPRFSFIMRARGKIIGENGEKLKERAKTLKKKSFFHFLFPFLFRTKNSYVH